MRRAIPEEIIPLLADCERGLSDAEASERRARFGPNDIIEKPPGGWRVLAIETARDPMLWFLIITSLMFFFLGDITEGVVLFVAVIPLVGMDLYLHRRTAASTAGLHSYLASTAVVVRNGRERLLPAEELVPGDLVIVALGDSFPADGILLRAEHVQVDESSLSGEAWPLRKRAAADELVAKNATMFEECYWGLAGTRLLTGRATLRVAYCGRNTLYGEIVHSAIAGAHARTPLQQAIAQLVVVLLIAAAIICLLLGLVRLHQGYGLADALLSAITLAVAALPEEFPVVFTFFLGVGVFRLARRKALVRRAVAVENIGRITAICSDKTGTITEGRLTLTHISPSLDMGRTLLLRLAALAARSDSGDPLDAALLAESPGMEDYQVLETFPFTEDSKRETAIARDHKGGLLAVTKGAPETVLALCELDAERHNAALDETANFAAGGHKVIACAWRPLGVDGWPGGEPDRDFIFAGLLAFEDPVRDGVADAVTECLKAGIKVLMITGDHPITATAIAREVGLGVGNPRVITADTFEQQLERDGSFVLRDVDAVARAIPSQKLHLVRRLQKEGMIVAVTGDGVNDVPALQAADIGIAMGERGTRSAREVSAIVLLDDNFRTITNAIAEGRQLFRNLQLSFAWLLMVHIPLVFTAALIPLLGYPLLYQPIHVVWLEMIIHPTALLVFQQLPEQRMTLNRRAVKGFFSWMEWLTIIAVGGLLTAIITFTYLRSFGDNGQMEHGRTMAIITLIVSGATLTAVLNRMKTRMAYYIIGASLLGSITLVQIPLFAEVLHLTPLHLDDWGIAFGSALLIALLPLAGTLVRR